MIRIQQKKFLNIQTWLELYQIQLKLSHLKCHRKDQSEAEWNRKLPLIRHEFIIFGQQDEL